MLMRRARGRKARPEEAPAGAPRQAGASRRPQPLVTERVHGTRRAVEPVEYKKRSDAARHPVVILANLVILLLVMGMIGGVAALVLGRDAYFASGPLEEDVAVVIDRGSSVQEIATGLEERGVINNRYVFLAAALWSGDNKTLQAGEYRIPAQASMAEVLERIASGSVVQHSVTFAEGLSSQQVVERLLENDVLAGTLDEIPPEGALLPETYAVTRGMRRERVVELMRTAMERALAEAWSQRAPDLPLETPQELLTLASIVEKETGQADERAEVAGVFVNRLREGMRLQSDPTILYGIYGGDAWNRSRTIFRSEIDRETPYNTYQIPALPPGPIANPGREALMAAANPAETDALYFVADGTGGHAFAVTYEEHQRNVARWREIERARAGEPAAETTTQ